MDFVTGLPNTLRGHNMSWMMVDRLTKSAHFIPISVHFPKLMLAEIYIRVIMKLHGVSLNIVSDTGLRFTYGFWKSLHDALGSKLRLSSTYHPQTDVQTERNLQSLVDLLRAFLGPEIVRQTIEKVKLIRDKMKTSLSRKMSYHNKRRKDLEFQEGDRVFLRVTLVTGVDRALKLRKFTHRFIGPYTISNNVETIGYRVALPPNLSNLHDVFHVSQLRKYILNPSHVIFMDDVKVWDNLTVENVPVSQLLLTLYLQMYMEHPNMFLKGVVCNDVKHDIAMDNVKLDEVKHDIKLDEARGRSNSSTLNYRLMTI
ncbi:uncharacterized protein LOC131635876 [Vicia villosa]|uniref:uncharacterized protein LOC131635876 n=1 Tax=Vicia villosa TaxID=3911 RepID=UPI00273B8332|nr:uncharacterized protein LOC131635876 [Vicia villosa]